MPRQDASTASNGLNHYATMLAPMYNILKTLNYQSFFKKFGRQRDRQRDLPLVYSLNACNSQSWAMQKPEAYNSIQGWQGPSYFSDHPLLLRVYINKELGMEAELGLDPRHTDMGCRCPKHQISTSPAQVVFSVCLMTICKWGFPHPTILSLGLI